MYEEEKYKCQSGYDQSCCNCVSETRQRSFHIDRIETDSLFFCITLIPYYGSKYDKHCIDCTPYAVEQRHTLHKNTIYNFIQLKVEQYHRTDHREYCISNQTAPKPFF